MNLISKYGEIEQGSPEWHAIRAGKVTASQIADLLSKGRNGEESAGRRNYRAQLVCERLTGVKAQGFTSGAMQRGIELEPVARSIYEIKQDCTVFQLAFIDHPSIEWSGASPDGILFADGQIEIKCPLPATHLETLLSKESPTQYYPQMQWQLACTGREWCDFISYAPEFPEHLQLFVKRVFRDDAFIKEAEEKVVIFLDEVEKMVNKLKDMKNGYS